MFRVICVGSILALALVGCGGGGGDTGTAFVVGMNAIPNIGSVSISANGSVVLNNAAYSTISTGFVAVNSGTNAPLFLTNASSTQLASGTTTFVVSDYYAAFAMGSTVNQFLFVYPIDVSQPAANNGRLIFVTASLLQPSVDVYVTPSGSPLAPPTITSMTPFNSGKESGALPAGTYDVQFRAAGTATVLVDEPAVVIGSSTTTNEIQIVGITDSPTGSAAAQQALPLIPVPVVASAGPLSNIGKPIVVGHPGMTSFAIGK